MTMRQPIEVLVAGSHPAMRASLCSALALEGDIHVAGMAADIFAAMRIAGSRTCSVAIVDAKMVALGSPAVGALMPLARRLPVIVMGMGQSDDYAEPYVAAGAIGYWEKSDDISALTALLRRAAVKQRSAA
jgi:DNA-binding NarL/FixJ family response regulator